MSNRKDFFDKPLFTIPNYIYILLLGGFYFFICNPLLIFFYIITFINANNFNFSFLFLSLIPLGPSLTALYSSMNKLYREKNINISSYFFSSYKNNFKDSMKLWLVQLSLLVLFTVDFTYFYAWKSKLGIHIVFALLILYLIIVGLYAFPITSRFEMKVKDIIILSFYYTFKKFPLTILKAIVIILVFKFTVNIPPLLLLFLPSAICLLFSHYDEPMLKEIEARK